MKRQRLRDLGIAIGLLNCGRHNAITDVKGVRVGHKTLIRGEGKLRPGKGPVRTGVTVVMPHLGNLWQDRVSAGSFVLNGNGNVSGLDWLRESGALEGPIALTNTHSVGDVQKGLTKWMIDRYPDIGIDDETYLPVVAECDDSSLNDAQGFHIKAKHVRAAITAATESGHEVAEGNCGAGVGMSCYDFKGGIGTSSRVLAPEQGGFTVGVLVNCNHGDREQLVIGGVPVGRCIPEEKTSLHREGSIVIVVACDAPLNSLQLNRVAKRAALGLARTGSTAHGGSGDFVLAFSTTRQLPRHTKAKVLHLQELSDEHIDPIYQAAAEATEEAIANALCMAETMVGRDGNTSSAMPLDRLVKVFRHHGMMHS